MAYVILHGNKVALSGTFPEKGSNAKDFKLTRKDFSDVDLTAFKGKKKLLNVVLSFDTSICSASAKKFEEKLSSLDNLIVINISADLPFAQDRFCKSNNIEHSEILSAFRSTFAKDYGLEMADGPMKGLTARAVIIIDENDKVIYTELVPEIGQEPDYESAIQHLG